MSGTRFTGGCHCGAVRYVADGLPLRHSVCHCSDCRRSTGAPFVAWMLFQRPAVEIRGATRSYASSDQGLRHFCPLCGTGLFYTSDALFPGQIDVQSATLDEPEKAVPTEQVQVAERLPWVADLALLRIYERYPVQE